MNSVEIDDFLKANPLEVFNKSLCGGRHRALAIVGSLIQGVKINKIWIIEKTKTDLKKY